MRSSEGGSSRQTHADLELPALGCRDVAGPMPRREGVARAACGQRGAQQKRQRRTHAGPVTACGLYSNVNATRPYVFALISPPAACRYFSQKSCAST